MSFGDDPYNSLAEVNVANPYPHEFAHPTASGIEKLTNGAVPHIVRCLYQSYYVGLGERLGKRSMNGSRGNKPGSELIDNATSTKEIKKAP